jgi:hypothetical protein
MTLDLHSLGDNPAHVEAIEKATLRLVVQSLVDMREEISTSFTAEQDLVADIGEDLTREALDRMGTSIIPVRLFGKMDYKRSRYLFFPEFAVRQALFVDSKAEKSGVVARIQPDQTSMRIKQIRAGVEIDEQGGLPLTIPHEDGDLLTTTVFVKYSYSVNAGRNVLNAINAIALPSGLLQSRYNPTPNDSIWNAGPNAPSRGERFRARIALRLLKAKARWRVQTIPGDPSVAYTWQEQ